MTNKDLMAEIFGDLYPELRKGQSAPHGSRPDERELGGLTVTDCPKCADMRDHLAAEHMLRVQIERERLETARQAMRLLNENTRLRAAAEEVLSWPTKDMAMLLSNPPQNAALFRAQSVLRKALEKKPSCVG